MRQILVSHPHAAEIASRASGALAEHGILAGYVTGVAAAETSLAGRVLARLAHHRPVLNNRIISGVGGDHVTALGAVELGARAVARALGGRLSTYDALFVAHDAVAAALPWPRAVDGVLAYEDGAERTFRRARAQGMTCVLDLPAPHPAHVAQVLAAEHSRWSGAERAPRLEEPAWKQRRKASELELASVLSVASTFTASTLEGLDKEVWVTPYGFPVDRFPPRASPPRGPFTVLSAGALGVRKGTPYLLEAWKKAALPDARLILVGRLDLAPEYLARYAGHFEHVPGVPRSRMGSYYRAADLVVFPAIADGFGLVMLEAMCSGTPVLATRASGGPDVITDGEDGLLIPEREVDALVEGLIEASRDRERLAVLGRRARARAERRSWAEAGRELVGRFQSERPHSSTGC